MILTKEFRFEASHQLPHHDGKCARLHGHSWKLEVAVEAPIIANIGHPKEGMVLDYADIKRAVEPVIERLDHHHLGSGYVATSGALQFLGADWFDFPLVPTSENLLIWIANQLPIELPWVQLQLNETCTSSCILTREDWSQNYATDEKTLAEETRETPRRSEETQGRQENEVAVHPDFKADVEEDNDISW